MLSASERHKAELTRFRDLLSQEAYQTQLLTPADGVPYDTLLVRIESSEQENRVWRLELSFLPGLENDLEGVSILQCYVPLSDQIAEEHMTSLNRIIITVNSKLPIGAFGLLDNPRMLFFKHNAMLPDADPGAGYQIVHELVPMTTYLTSLFSEPLIQVATGQKSGEEALADMPFSKVFSSD